MSGRIGSIVTLAVLVLGFTSVALGAAETPAAGPGGALFSDVGAGRFGGPIGAGLVLIGGAAGIGRIAASACENIARQPEAGGRIFTSMIITAAMIEGATLFGVVVCYFPASR